MTAASRAVQAPPPWPGEAVGATQVILALHKALWLSLVPRADGSRHHMRCRNARVNSQMFPCSDPCEYVNGAALLAEDWSEG